MPRKALLVHCIPLCSIGTVENMTIATNILADALLHWNVEMKHVLAPAIDKHVGNPQDFCNDIVYRLHLTYPCANEDALGKLLIHFQLHGNSPLYYEPSMNYSDKLKPCYQFTSHMELDVFAANCACIDRHSVDWQLLQHYDSFLWHKFLYGTSSNHDLYKPLQVVEYTACPFKH